MLIRLAAVCVVASTAILTFGKPLKPDLQTVCLSNSARPIDVIQACTTLIEDDTQPAEYVQVFLKERGWAYYCTRQYDNAVADENRVLALRPEDRFALITRAYSHSALGNQDAAIADYERVLRQEQDNTDIRYRIAKLQLKTGQIDAAQAGFKDVLDIDPAHSDAGYAAANAYYTHDGWEEALAFLEQAQVNWPEQSWAYSAEVSLHLKETGDAERALEAAAQYSRLQPVTYAQHFLPALIHFELGDEDTGIAWVQEFAAQSVKDMHADMTIVRRLIWKASTLTFYGQDLEWSFRAIAFASAGRTDLAKQEIDAFIRDSRVDARQVVLNMAARQGVEVSEQARAGDPEHFDLAVMAYLEKLRDDIGLVPAAN